MLTYISKCVAISEIWNFSKLNYIYIDLSTFQSFWALSSFHHLNCWRHLSLFCWLQIVNVFIFLRCKYKLWRVPSGPFIFRTPKLESFQLQALLLQHFNFLTSKLIDHFFQVTVENQSYHKSCFKCSHGGCSLNPSNYAALDGILYCKPHFSQLFKEKGSYNHLIKSASMKRPAATVPDS